MEADFRTMNLVSFVFRKEFGFSLRSPSRSFVIMNQPNDMAIADVIISIFFNP